VRRFAVLVSLFVLGCGAAEPGAPTDRAAVQARVATYVKHLLAGEGEQACAQLTPDYRQRADARAEAAGFGSCADAYAIYGESVGGLLSKSAVRLAGDPRSVAVILRGDRAEAAMRVPGAKLSIKRATLRRVGDRWLIDSLGLTRPPR
jgi:hypothetical protein